MQICFRPAPRGRLLLTSAAAAVALALAGGSDARADGSAHGPGAREQTARPPVPASLPRAFHRTGRAPSLRRGGRMASRRSRPPRRPRARAHASLAAGLHFQTFGASCLVGMNFFGMERSSSIQVANPYAIGTKWVYSRHDLYWWNAATGSWAYWKSSPLRYADAQPLGLTRPDGLNWYYVQGGGFASGQEVFPNLPSGYHFQVTQPIWWQDSAGRWVDSVTANLTHYNQQSTESRWCWAWA